MSIWLYDFLGVCLWVWVQVCACVIMHMCGVCVEFAMHSKAILHNLQKSVFNAGPLAENIM